MVQIDQMPLSKNNISVKDIGAWHPVSKYVEAELYKSATSISAKKFLEKLLKTAPFAIKSIQVDGGSEFMSEFEESC